MLSGPVASASPKIILKALRDAAIPRTQTEMRSFLGLCNVYRRFVPKFTAIAAPLNSYLTKGKPALLGKLSSEALVAFDTLRQRLLNTPILALSRRAGYFWLDTDASDSQLGGCLFQEQLTGPNLPLGFCSRTLKAAERNYSTTERECLAIVWAVTHIRPYLEGVEFTVLTDHHAMRWVMNLAEAQGRLARWRLRPSEFAFKVEYSPGTTHHAADVLSRLPSKGVSQSPIEVDIPVAVVELKDPSRPLALEANSADPVKDIEVLHTEKLFYIIAGITSAYAMQPAWRKTPSVTTMPTDCLFSDAPMGRCMFISIIPSVTAAHMRLFDPHGPSLRTLWRSASWSDGPS
jgi:hypothetical protein